MATRLALPLALIGTCLGIVLTESGASQVVRPAGVALLGAGLLVAVLRRPGLGAAVVLAGIGLLAGSWRASATALPIGPDSLVALIRSEERSLVGTLVEDPVPAGEWQRLVLDDLRLPADGTRVRGRLQVRVPRALSLSTGDRLAVRGVVEAPPVLEEFDYRAYLARQGIGAVMLTREPRLLGIRGGIGAWVAGLRAWLLGGVLRVIPEPEAALGAGILLGVRSGIAPRVQDAFATAGLTHVVAISGWNIAIVAALIGAMTRPLARGPGGRWLAALVGALAITSYVLLTGASPSVVRAALMAAALLIARLGGSTAHALSALMAAALLMLLVSPPVLWDVGFQLSTLATAGLILYAAGIEARLARWPALVRGPVSLTLAAQITTLPVVVGTFDRLSLVAPLANVVVVPLVPLVMLAAAMATAVGVLAPLLPVELLGSVLGWAAGGSAWLLLRVMIVVGELAAALPLASLSTTTPAWLGVAWYPGLAALGWWRSRRPPPPEPGHRIGLGETRGGPPRDGLASRPLRWLARPAPAASGCIGVLLAISVAGLPDGRLHLTMLDIGQGDAILVETPNGGTLLIDGGPDPDLLLQRLGETLPFWQRSIDVVLLTHPHQDHVAGLPGVLERFDVRLILDPGRSYPNPAYARFLELAADEPDARVASARAGMRIALDPTTTLTVLYPDRSDADAPLSMGDINNASVVVRLESGGFSALLTGDAEAPVESLLGARGLLEPATVLKVAHHGSESGTTPAFLAIIRPRVALISTGAGNDYGHPHRVTLDHLAQVPRIRVYRTDRDGSIEVVSDGAHLTVGSATGRIGAWPSPPATTPSGSSPRTTFPIRSWLIPGAWRPWPARRRACWSPTGWRSTPNWPRWRACSTTSTSWSPAAPGRSTARSPPAGWPTWATPSCPTRWPPTRCSVCSMRRPRRVTGRQRWSTSPTGTSIAGS